MNFTDGLGKFSELFKRHYKAVLVAGLVLASFFVGRSCAPTVTDMQTRTVVEYKDKIVERVVEVEKIVHVRGKDRVVYRERIVRPDGTTEERETEKETEKETVTTDKDKTTDTVRTVEVEKIVEVEKRVAVQPRFRVGVLLGYDVLHNLNGARGLNLNGAVLGAQAEVRLLGPVWLGVTAQTTGVIGGSVGVTF